MGTGYCVLLCDAERGGGWGDASAMRNSHGDPILIGGAATVMFDIYINIASLTTLLLSKYAQQYYLPL